MKQPLNEETHAGQMTENLNFIRKLLSELHLSRAAYGRADLHDVFTSPPSPQDEKLQLQLQTTTPGMRKKVSANYNIYNLNNPTQTFPEKLQKT